MERRLMLLSSAYAGERAFLDHARDAIADFLSVSRKALFIPYGQPPNQYDHYEDDVKRFFEKLGVPIQSIHNVPDSRNAGFDAVVVGGGNPFRLLKLLQEKHLTEEIRRGVYDGVPYVGWDAGSLVACHTIRTTNDMPIVSPDSLNALGLVHFQINPHYPEEEKVSYQTIATREQRLLELLEEDENYEPAIGLREGSWLRVTDDLVELQGTMKAPVFRKGDRYPWEYSPGSTFDIRLKPQRIVW